MVSKAAYTLAWFKAVAQNCIPCNHRSACTVNVPNSFQNAIEEEDKMNGKFLEGTFAFEYDGVLRKTTNVIIWITS